MFLSRWCFWSYKFRVYFKGSFWLELSRKWDRTHFLIVNFFKLFVRRQDVVAIPWFVCEFVFVFHLWIFELIITPINNGTKLLVAWYCMCFMCRQSMILVKSKFNKLAGSQKRCISPDIVLKAVVQFFPIFLELLVWGIFGPKMKSDKVSRIGV